MVSNISVKYYGEPLIFGFVLYARIYLMPWDILKIVLEFNLEGRTMSKILLKCEVEYELSVRDLSEFLVDLAFLYDRCLLFKENPHNPILYSPNFYRRWRRLPRGLELKILEICKGSSLEIILLIGASLPALKMFLDILKIIMDWNIEKERGELENIERKIKILKEAHNIPPELLPLIERDLNKVFGSSIKIKKLEKIR